MTSPTPAGFVRAYHLTSLEHAKSNIKHRRLKLATFSDANDPFELLALNCRGKSRREARKKLRLLKAAQSKKIGLLCFSRSWMNPVLWSHYADRHRGVCLGFDIRQVMVEDVQYKGHLLTLHLGDEQDPVIPEDLLQDLRVTKFVSWNYEQELRRFVTLSDVKPVKKLYFWPFDENMRLREVILGPMCPAAHLASIRRLVRAAGQDALVSKARLAFGSFEVRPHN